MPRTTDIAGQVFGRWVVIKKVENTVRRSAWVCKCECGNIKTVKQKYLTNGDSRSCGCISRELTTRRNTTHGMSGIPEYRIWNAIRDRCLNPRDKGYENYGGRGIKVCDHWQNSFENFFADMGPRPSSKHSIDRINNDGPYSPENCRWATAKEQRINQRPRRLLGKGYAQIKPNKWWVGVGNGVQKYVRTEAEAVKLRAEAVAKRELERQK